MKQHKKLTALILCFTMLFSITSGIFSAAFASDSTTGSAYSLDTTTGSAISGSGLWDSTTGSVYQLEDEEDAEGKHNTSQSASSLKSFKMSKAVTTESSVKIEEFDWNMNLAVFYGDMIPEIQENKKFVITADSMDMYGEIIDPTAVSFVKVEGAQGFEVNAITKVSFEKYGSSYVLYRCDYIGNDEKFREISAKYPYIPEHYLSEIETNEQDEEESLIGQTVQFNITYPSLYPSIGGTGFGTMKEVPSAMVIKEKHTDKNGDVWYYVDAVEGEIWPADCADYHYVKASDVVVVEEDDEEEENESTNPCAICGETNCKVAHLYCEVCSEFDCGMTHIYENPYKPVTTPVIPNNPEITPDADVSIVDADGNAIDEMGIYLLPGEKTSISAWSDLENQGNVSYQWQICYDTDNDLWVDIQGQNGKGMLISPAMVQSIIDVTGEALIRCEVTLGNNVQHSDEIPVTVVNNAPLMSRFGLARNVDDEIVSDVSSENQQYTVSIRYVFDDGGATAFGSYVATLAAGSNLHDTIKHPTIVGYLPYIGTDDETSEEIVLSISNIQEDMTYEVRYKPTTVNYTVIHYQQNADNDNYIQVLQETKQALTGTVLKTINDTAATPEDKIENVYDGFYALLFDDSEKVKADGTTVVEIYYDRLYYLLLFELDGGYGVEPIFARYGDTIEIVDPTKPGYQFQGWTNVNGNAISIPSTVPLNGGTYYATWKQVDTTYTVAYWIQNDNGTNTNIGSKIVGANSGDIVSGTNDLSINTNVCGLPEHSHDSCTLTCPLTEHTTHDDGHCVYTCGKTFHDHSSGCECQKSLCTNHTRECYNFTAATVAEKASSNISSNNVTTNSGISVYRTGNWNNYRYYAKLGDQYYQISNYSTSTSLAHTFKCHPTHDSNCCTIEFHDHATCTCNSTHTHQASCYSCKSIAHTHTDACKANLAKYVDFVSAQQNIEVKGDGSTVVNVYYEYRTYTIRFIYAKQNGSNYQVATSTSNGNLNNCSWSSNIYSALPTVTNPNKQQNGTTVQINGTTYYYISLTAKFGENITDDWPAANVGQAGNYYWGSWAAAAGTGYRKTYGDEHANIVGPYPVMSADMIVDNPEKLSDGTYLAQNMIAWWGNSGNNISAHAYHNYFELAPGEDTAGAVEYGGKYYKLEETFTFTAAHNNTTRVDPIYFSGYECINDTQGTTNDTQANSSNFADNKDCPNSPNKCSYCNVFYYDRNMHQLYFWNYNGLMDSGVGESVPYGASLSSYGAERNNDYMAAHYPADMKPGAYQFAGWYTTADCSDGTKMVWTSTMPDADMTVYAKYVPITHVVNYYLTRDSLTRGETIPVEMNRLVDAALDAGKISVRPAEDPYTENFSQIGVQHGDYIQNPETPGVAAGYETVHPRAGYEFVGWFYLDEDGEETAFDPNNIPVSQDLDLYGKWSSNVLQPYAVYFKLKDTDTQIADPIEGSAPAGTNKTIEAKGGMDLYEGYQEGYFPEGSKYAVTLTIGTVADNTYTFWYVQKEVAPYSVYYVTETPKAGTAPETIVLDGKTYYIVAPTKTVDENRQAIITENFVVVNGYVPDAYQKSLILEAEKKNKIIFNYTVNTTQAYYKITHYTEGMSDGTWTEYASSQILGTIGTQYTAESMTITGFTYNETVNGTLKQGTLTENGLELKLYYVRNQYPYEVRYLEQHTGKTLEEATKGTAEYGRTFTGTAKDIPNYTVVGESTQTKNVLIEESNEVAKLNVITFYYAEHEATINYVVVGPDGCGTVTPESETVKVASATNAVGAKATANTNYKFVGWYDSPECTGDTVSTLASFKPTKPGDKWLDTTYYAKFELDIADLTIIKSGWESIDENQSFLFTVTGPSGFTLDVVIHGNGSVTIKDLLVGTYTVTEKTNWSWRYNPVEETSKSISITPSGDNIVVYQNIRSTEKIYWLNGNAWRDFHNGTSTGSPSVDVISLAFVDMILRDEEQDDELTVQLA